MELGAFYILILALVFVEFSSTVMVADSNKVTHSIKCTIYGNISMVPKKKKKLKRGMSAKSERPNISAMFAALLFLTEGYGRRASPVKIASPPAHPGRGVSVRMCVWVCVRVFLNQVSIRHFFLVKWQLSLKPVFIPPSILDTPFPIILDSVPPVSSFGFFFLLLLNSCIAESVEGTPLGSFYEMHCCSLQSHMKTHFSQGPWGGDADYDVTL